MKEPKALNSVAAFHKMFNLPVLETLSIPDDKRCALRVELLQEELNELKEAIEQKDIVEIVDALCDLQYVLSGAILEFGLGKDFDRCFSEVHQSNMSKACATEEEALETQQKYMDKDGTASYVKQVDEDYLVYRASDSKVLKSVNYLPADLESIVESIQQK